MKLTHAVRRALPLAVFFLFLGAALAPAQVLAEGKDKRGTPEERLDRHLAHMTEMLGLSTEQAAQIRPILAKHFEQRRALKNSDAGEDAKTAQFKALRKDTRQKVAALLTKEQAAKYREFHQKHKSDRKHKQGSKPGDHKHHGEHKDHGEHKHEGDHKHAH